MHRLGGGSAASSRMSARKGDGIITGRSALSHASSLLDEVATARSSARVNGPLDAEHLLKNPKEEGGYDYWLRFMEMDVRNFQREEQVRKAEQKKRMNDQKKYLDEQVTMKAKAKQAAREADLSWGLEIKKDYNKWQEENLVAEAKALEQRKQFVKATDQILAEVEDRRYKELQQEMDMDRQ